MKSRLYSWGRTHLFWLAGIVGGVVLGGVLPRAEAANNALVSWNNLGMHCMDSDYSVFSILPPYNTVEAQLIVAGRLVTNGAGYTVTYQAVADPDGSINSTSIGKGNFPQYAEALYGAVLSPDAGLAGWSMPGRSNVPQAMLFEATNEPAPGALVRTRWFRAEGIPITPIDDAGRKNPYPLMRLIARNGGGTPIATNDVVLPVSDEMDCRTCHASGSQSAARPSAGWVWSPEAERDYRLNILRLHDGRRNPSRYPQQLAAVGYNPKGLYRTVVADGKPVLCARCHLSEALPGSGFGTIRPLTTAVHRRHANTVDPRSGLTLNDTANRSACYLCHPGSSTRCLRGAMGGAVATDGTMAMQCQSCHGGMLAVGAAERTGWFEEPNCQSCHTGDAMNNHGQMRYTSVFEPDGTTRVPTNTLFATNPDTPAPGLSLYRFSSGHGGLQCSACHGSTHAEFPATHRNDNLRNVALQGHAGVTADCTACHVSMASSSATERAGPHGMHPIGAGWVSYHHDAIHSDTDHLKCAPCHGSDFRGTELSKTLGPRRLTASLDGGSVTLNLFQGAMVGCYNCHNGPRSESLNTSAAPVAQGVELSTTAGAFVSVDLPVTGAGAVARIISQPAHGSVGLSNRTATYFPEPGFVGQDQFTFAAWNGSKNSQLATGTVSVAEGPAAVTVQAMVPSLYPARWPVPFGAAVAQSNRLGAVTCRWEFGDGSPVRSGPDSHLEHVYAVPGTYSWSVTVEAGSATATAAGSITIGPPAELAATPEAGQITVVWPASLADAVLEESTSLGPDASWVPSTAVISPGAGFWLARRAVDGETVFLRLRRVQ